MNVVFLSKNPKKVLNIKILYLLSRIYFHNLVVYKSRKPLLINIKVVIIVSFGNIKMESEVVFRRKSGELTSRRIVSLLLPLTLLIDIVYSKNSRKMHGPRYTFRSKHNW